MTGEKSGKYVDLDGKRYETKPESMTQLRGNILVPKTHPRIILRGKLDSLAACVINAQIVAMENSEDGVARDLQSIMDCISLILMSEVADVPMKTVSILGMDGDKLRAVSHFPKTHLGVDHMIPHSSMGKAFAAVNAVRTLSREAELQADLAFQEKDGTILRPDIILTMNRLSSAAYIIMCRILGDHYKKNASL